MTDLYLDKGTEIGAIVSEKNKAYGDSFNRAPKILAVLYPEGISVGQYDDVLTVVRILDKLSRIATDRDAFGENPWNDIAGYAILASIERDKRMVQK